MLMHETKASMSTIKQIGVLFLATGIVATAACGGGGASGGGSSAGGGHGTTVAGPNVPHTSTGDAVSVEAQNHWTEGLAAFARRETSGWNAAVCESVAGTFDEAAEAQDGRFPEALYMAGLVHSRCSEREKALEYYNRALSVNNKFCKARVMIGLDQIGQHQEAAAMQTFARAVADDAQCTEGYVNLAALQRSSGDAALVRDALNNLRRALAIDAQYLAAFNEMALLYIQEAERTPEEAAQRLDLAAVVCRQAQQINREYGPIYNTWGLIYVKKDNIIEAVRMFERAANLDANNFEAWMNFGTMVSGFRGYEDAKRAFTRAVELNPSSYDAHLGLGAALRGLSQFDEAVAEYTKAKELDANRPEAYFNLALINHNYRGGAEAVLNDAKVQYQAFVTKAGQNPRFASVVTDVTRRCNLERARRGRRRSTSQCRPGFLQQIEIVASTRAEMAELQRAQEEIQRRMVAQQAAAGTPPTPAPGPAPDGAATPAPTPTPPGPTAPAPGPAAPAPH